MSGEWGLDNKVALVTGGGAAAEGIGNGRAAAILLARAGAKVAVADRDLGLAEKTVEMIAAEGGAAIALAVDVTQEADCAAMVQAVLKRYGRLDGLDNNVGVGSQGSVVEMAEAYWQKVMRINLDSMFLVAKHAIPAMTASGDGGAIVNISSISALRPRGLTVYSTSKGAVIALTKAMAVDHGPDKIRVNCVAPGPVYTPMVYERGMSETAREQRRKASVLGLEGSGWDVGMAVRFLLSDQARFITGQTLIVDGGATLVGPSRESSPRFEED